LEKIIGDVVRRDVPPDGLARRYIGGGPLDEFIDYFLMNARDLGTEPGVQARSIADSALETVARRDSADDFINALLTSRDSSTPESLLSLASRALDDLD
jgi:hypothetical protein